MKKIYAFILVSFLAGAAFGQTYEITNLEQKDLQKPAITTGKTTGVIDTLTPYLDRATAFYQLTAGSSGYVCGTNSITTEIAVHYDAQGASATVTEVMVYFVHKEIMGGSADDMQVTCYAANPDSTPGATALATGTFSVNDADTSGLPTFVMLNGGGANVTGEFLVGVNYDPLTYDDTIAVFSTNPTSTNGGPDGANERRNFQFTVQGWLNMSDIWTIAGQGYNADALICPIVDVIPTGIEDGITNNGLTLKAHYPNPATDIVNLRFAIDQAQDMEIIVMDNQGRTVDTMNFRKTAGDHEVSLNVSNYAAGKYYYQVRSENASWTSKFIVVK